MAVSRINEAGLNVNQYGNRNVIINGAMKVAQRGTQTNSTNAYTACDRWEFIEGGSSVITSSQDSDSPQGFANSLKLDVTTASGTPSSGDYAIVRTKLEGQDLQNLLYGTSSAKQITISFSVKSPKAGTHYVELIHNSAGAMNSIAYTVNSANTWENKVVTFDGYQTTALNNDANSGLLIYFWLMAGSNYTSGTHSSNTWHTTNANRAAGQVNAMDNTANNFYLTGVQLEVGDTATDFEHRTFGDELARCQRYYQRWTANDAADSICSGPMISDTAFLGEYFFRETMRAEPTLGYSSGDFQIRIKSQDRAIVGNPQLNRATTDNLQFYVVIADNNEDGLPGFFKAQTAGTYVEFISEL
jgi:hypothetical protein